VSNDAGEDAASSDVISEVATPEPPAKRNKRSWFIEWGVIIVVALVVAFIVRTYVAQTFYIPSGSMEPTLQIGDRILVSKLSTELGTVHIGDILVFKRPADENCGSAPTAYLVKRVIGLPGDHLTSRGNTIYVNGKALKQTWTYYNPVSPPIGNVTVPKNHYFMMGDNHGDSCDSRYWGPLASNLVVGKAVLRIWPLSRFGGL